MNKPEEVARKLASDYLVPQAEFTVGEIAKFEQRFLVAAGCFIPVHARHDWIHQQLFSQG